MNKFKVGDMIVLDSAKVNVVANEMIYVIIEVNITATEIYSQTPTYRIRNVFNSRVYIWAFSVTDANYRFANTAERILFYNENK